MARKDCPAKGISQSHARGEEIKSIIAEIIQFITVKIRIP